MRAKRWVIAIENCESDGHRCGYGSHGDGDVSVAMFRLLLRDGQIFEEDTLTSTTHYSERISWVISMRRNSPQSNEALYSRRLCIQPPSPGPWVLVPLNSEVNLVSEVVAHFKYSQMTHPLRRAGDDAKAFGPPEAQHLDGF